MNILFFFVLSLLSVIKDFKYDDALEWIENELNKEGKNIAETIICPDISRKIIKYSSFVRVDDKKYLNILKKTFTKSQ